MTNFRTFRVPAGLSFAVALLLTAPAAAADNVQERLTLGEQLMSRQEWFRAGTSFMEAALLSTGATSQSAWLRAGDAHREARQYERAIDWYHEAARIEGPQTERALVRIGASYYLSADYAMAQRTLVAFAQKHPESPLMHEAGLYAALAAVGRGDFHNAALTYEFLASDRFAADTQARLRGLAQESRGAFALPRRSRGLAMLLSAFLPGAGQAYTGHWAEAGTALGVNALFGILIWDSLLKARDRAEVPHRGWAYTTTALYGFVGSSFYFGNVYGAAVGAERFNRRQISGLQEHLKDETMRLRLLTVPLE